MPSDRVRLAAAEQHIRDLEQSRDEMLAQFKKNDLVRRVTALEQAAKAKKK
jgi:hypothetical protein